MRDVLGTGESLLSLGSNGEHDVAGAPRNLGSTGVRDEPGRFCGATTTDIRGCKLTCFLVGGLVEGEELDEPERTVGEVFGTALGAGARFLFRSLFKSFLDFLEETGVKGSPCESSELGMGGLTARGTETGLVILSSVSLREAHSALERANSAISVSIFDLRSRTMASVAAMVA